jgi:predicted  nucleic acid-binding Zn-ribbon protein
MRIPLAEARLCLECDTIHDLESCPECGSSTFFYVGNWIKPSRPPHRPEKQEAKPAAPPKKGHWVRNSLVAGASLIAAYEFLFKPSRRK